MDDLRIPFSAAIEEPNLLKGWFSDLSLPQQVALKIMYGCSLSATKVDDRGWSELDYWSMFQEHCTYDELGFLKSTQPLPYIPKEYAEIWLPVGVRGGKALALDTPVLTPTGHTIVGDLQEGDLVFAADGSVTPITFATPVQQDRPCYRLTFSNGEQLVADADHKWLVESYCSRKNNSRRLIPKEEKQVKTTKELYETQKARKSRPQTNWAIDVGKAWDLPSQDLELDPYLLGIWLGDGTTGGGSITTADPEIVASFEAAGFVVKKATWDKYVYAVTGKQLFNKQQSFRSKLGRLGVLGNKHVPPAYMRGSYKQRLALLQGLMDSDGWVRPRGDTCEFDQMKRGLAEQVRELVTSLGIKSTIRNKDARLNGRVVGRVWTVAFSPHVPVFRLTRKLSKLKLGNEPAKRFRLYIEKVEVVPSVPVRCFQVAHPSHLFQVGYTGIVTHNTDRVAATITAYEATCGGHESWARPGRPIICFQIAQDLRMAKYSLHSIRGIIETMPWCVGWIKDVTADRIDLSNGVTIAVTPPTVKSIRGYDSPVAVFDEVGVWYTESDSANPDREIYRQASSRQAQFRCPKLVGISSAWAKQGLLYERYAAGTEGSKLSCDRCREHPLEDCPDCAKLRLPHQGRLLLHSTTAGLANPLVKKEWLRTQFNADPKAFERECLTVFQDSLSGFLDSKKLSAAVDQGIVSRPPKDGFLYQAAIDPAFRHDSFAFTIVHAERERGIVQDYVMRWVPPHGLQLNPSDILKEIVPVLRYYKISSVATDQYQAESLNQLALQQGFTLEPTDFTATSKADIYGNLKSLVNQGRLRLLDDPDTVRELKQLEARLTSGGTVQIAAPEGQHDDLATVVALAAKKAVWMLPLLEEPVKKVKTLKDELDEQVMAAYKAKANRWESEDDW